MKTYVSIVGIIWLMLSLTACQPEVEPGQFRPGLVDECVSLPIFIAQSDLAPPVAIDTRQQGYRGMRLLSMRNGQVWQHASWDDAGHVGAFVRDRQGHIYVAPMPEVSLSYNPPELQNRIYRIDAQTGVMSLWLVLSGEKPSTAQPLGVLGMSYDCDTDSLYVSSVAGSSAQAERGTLYRIDVASGQIEDRRRHTDVIGLGGFNDVRYKRLYLGAARTPDVYSVVLDEAGNFTEQVRHEFSLAQLPQGQASNARKFSFKQVPSGQYSMQIKEINFGFRLMAEHNPAKNIYHFKYQPSDDAWSFAGTSAESGAN